jgi:hypothetical protein
MNIFDKSVRESQERMSESKSERQREGEGAQGSIDQYFLPVKINDRPDQAGPNQGPIFSR